MKFKLTDLGKVMEAQLTAGSKPVITRIEASDAYSSNEGALLSVQNKKQDLEIEEIAVIEGASHLKFILHNVGLEEEYILRQVGIYARQSEDSEEILYIIGQDKSGERVPASSEKLVEYEYDLTIHTENTYEAQVVVKSSYFATKGEMEELDRQKVSASGGNVSGTVSGIQEPEKEEEKYPEPGNAWTVDKIFGGLFRWVKSLKSDKVDTAGGDIAGTTVSEFAAEAAQFPVPAPGEKTKTLWGKMKKFVEDFKAWYTGVCLIGHIVNNCTSGATNLPLSALQGKVLMDLYTQLYSDLQTAKSDVGTLDQKLSSYFPVKQKLQLDFTEHSYGYINKNATYVEDYGIDIVDHNFQSGITTTLRISDGKLRVIKRSADGTESYKDIINI